MVRRKDELSAADLRLLSGALATLYRHADLEEFPRRALEAVRPLVVTDHTSYNEVGPRRVIGVVDPPDDLHDALVPVFAEFVSQHPRVIYYPKSDDGSARTLSDYLTRAELHRTDLYQLVYRPMQVEDQLSIIAPGLRDLFVSLSFNRSTRSFTDRTRTLVNLIRPHFGRAFENARALQRLRDVISGGRAQVVCQTAVRLSESGEIRYQGPRSHELWDRYLPERRRADRLPRRIAAWVRKETLGATLHPRRSMKIRGEFGFLSVRLIHDPAAEGWLLILEEHAFPGGAGPPLPPRARQVFDLLLHGLGEKEVAARLGIRPSTVHDYVKEIYRRHGVSSRAELLARWIRRSADSDGAPD